MAASARTTHKPAARKGPTPRRAVLDAGRDEPTGPLVLSSAAAPEVERVVIAYLDDYELTMPAKVPPHIGLRLMRTQRRQGAEMAMTQLLEEVLGEEGFAKLADFKGLTEDNLIDLYVVVQKVAMGALEAPKATSSND